MDLDGNGTFDATEAQGVTVAAGTVNATAHLVFGTMVAAPGVTYLRCRISTNAAAIVQPVTAVPSTAPAPNSGDPYFRYNKASYTPNDQWPDGEVEDYGVTVASGSATTTLAATTTAAPTTRSTVSFSDPPT